MSALTLLLAVLFGLAASVAFYLGAPSQRILAKRLGLTVSLVSGGALALISLVLFLQVCGPAASAFILLTLIMAAWSGLPFLMAVIKPGRSRRT